MDNQPVISPDSSIQERLQAMKKNRESVTTAPTKAESDEKDITPKPEKRLKIERPLKDVTVELWQDMHYSVKNIATRFGKSEKDIMREAMEDGLKRQYKEHYKEFLDQFKKIFG